MFVLDRFIFYFAHVFILLLLWVKMVSFCSLAVMMCCPEVFSVYFFVCSFVCFLFCFVVVLYFCGDFCRGQNHLFLRFRWLVQL